MLSAAAFKPQLVEQLARLAGLLATKGSRSDAKALTQRFSTWALPLPPLWAFRERGGGDRTKAAREGARGWKWWVFISHK